MSFIGEALKMGLEVDGEILRIINKFLLNYETKAGASGGTALTLTKNVSFLTTTSGNGGFTLAAGKAGQVKILSLTSKSTTNATIVGTFGGGTTITMTTTGYGVVLVSDGTSWQTVGNNGSTVA